MKRFVVFFHLLCGMLFASGYEVSSNVALQAVADFRALNEDAGRYYYAPTDTIINNRDCHIDTLPMGVTWLADNTPKWLVFVDEQPHIHGWSHPCTYYYLPRYVDNPNNIPVYCFDGVFIPKVSNLTLADPSIIQDPTSPIAPPLFTINESTIIDPNASKFHAVIMGGGTSNKDNYAAFYNDTKKLYEVLTQRYGIPKSNVHVLLGSGGYEQGDLEHWYEGEHETWTTMPLDLDDDNIRDILGPFYYDSVDSLFTSLAMELNEQNHLMVVVDAHGDRYTGDIGLYNGNVLSKEKFRDLLDSINVASQFVLLSTCYSGHHINTLKYKPNRVVITSTQADQFENKGLYSYFLHCITNALNGIDCNNIEIDADLDHNGFISISELFNYAFNNYIESYEVHTGYDTVNEEDAKTPQYYARCPRLGEDFSLTHLPDPIALYIRDYVGDSGFDAIDINHQEMHPWKSPDIWVRNDNDGLTNMTSQPLQVSVEDNKVYIYTRINNRGWKAYNGQGRYLHLHWAPTKFTHNPTEWINPFPNNTHPELGIIPISTPIDTLQSTIISYEWTVPQMVVSQAINNDNGRLYVDILARISDSPYPVINDNTSLLYPFRYTSKKSVLAESTLAELSLVKNNAINQSISFPLSFTITTNDPDSISICLKDLSTDTLPTGVVVWLELSRALAYAFANDSTQTSVTLTPTDSICKFFNLSPQTYSLTAHIDINSNIISQTAVCDIPLSLKRGDETIGGFVMEASIIPRNSQLDPEIGDDNGGSEPGGDAGDGGEEGANNLGGGLRMLSMQRVDEPVTCEWTDPTGFTIGTGETLSLPLHAQGEYSLHVTALTDGAKATAKKTISSLLKIKDVVCVGGSITVRLTHAATNELSISLRPTVGEATPVVYPFSAGEKQLTISNNLTSGLYLITLLNGGNTLETKQVIIP